MHLHGGGGAQINTDDPDEIRQAVAFHRRHPTTRTLASLVTDRLDRMVTTVSLLARMNRAGEPGNVGIQLEGPFLNTCSTPCGRFITGIRGQPARHWPTAA